MINAKKILIVEDELSLQSILMDELKSEGFNVLVASNGEEGLEIAKKEKPDLILIDILLPKIDGITMAKEIKKTNSNMLMIFLTNLSDMKHIANATEAVYSDYIVKSDLNINDIISKVKEKLGLK
ncbi:response regulator [Patescibacteria group bacterium]|nr:response regulator [Patescibacteria group bacterium]